MEEQIPIREYEQAVYVYWYGSALPAVKIGHSNDPDRRLAQLGNDTGVPDHLASFAAIVWLDRKREKVEARAHELAAAFRRTGEWFDITASQALGYILDAAKELNVRYEVEDRGRVYVERTPDELRDEALAIDKWGLNWRVKEAAEESAQNHVSDAEEAVRDAELTVAVAKDWDRDYAISALEIARAALQRAEEKLDAAENDTTPAYSARTAEYKKRSIMQEAYWASHPAEWEKYKIASEAKAKESKFWSDVAKQKDGMSLEAVAAWNAKWEKR
jgi:hypothetical protein